MADAVIATTTFGATPGDLLKQAVTGARPAQAESNGAAAKPKAYARLRRWALPGAALSLGALVGALSVGLAATRSDPAGEALTKIQVSIEAGRSESARLNGEIERIGRSLASLRDANEAVRADAKSRNTAVSDRIAKAEATIAGKITDLGERQERLDREHGARIAALAAQFDRKSVSAPPAPAPQAAKAAPADPVQTGAIGDGKAKPATADKPATIEAWALREVYDGIAMIEDRKRRLVEVGPGDTVPGAGRVDAIERRGRAWVVVTKSGLITSQTW